MRIGALEHSHSAYGGAVVLGEAAVHVALDDGRLSGARLSDHQHFVKFLHIIAAAALSASVGHCPVPVHLWALLWLGTITVRLLVTGCPTNRTLSM